MEKEKRNDDNNNNNNKYILYTRVIQSAMIS